MLRLVVVVALVVLIWFLVLQVVRQSRAGRWDWKGIAAIVLFIALALWLSDLTGIGSIFG